MSVLAVEHPADGVLVLRLNRPARLNAVDEELLGALRQAFAGIAGDRSIRAVVLTGTGRGFCSGLDLRDFGPSMPAEDAPPIDRLQFQEAMAALPQMIRALPQPIVAAINGPAVGAGLSMCAASDIRICSTSASFANAAILIGLTGAEMGMSYLLPRLVGMSVAAEWMLTGRTVPAEEAFQRGLVSELLAADALMPRTIEIASLIASHSALGAQLTKRALQVNVDAPDLWSAIELENRNQLITRDTTEAAAAFARWANR